MTRNKLGSSALAALTLAAGLAVGHQESWKQPYVDGVKAAQIGKWSAARDLFKKSLVDRPEDEIKGGLIPAGPNKLSPYSANFAAAYCAYRMGLEASPDLASSYFKSSRQELEVLLGKQFAGNEVFYVLARLYALSGDANRAQAFDTQWKSGTVSFVDDNSMMAADDRKAMGLPDVPVTPKSAGQTNPVDSVKQKPLDEPPKKDTKPVKPDADTSGKSKGQDKVPDKGSDQRKPASDSTVKRKPLDADTGSHKSEPPSKQNTATGASQDNSPVQVVPNKFALIIGNSQTPLTDLAVPFAVDSSAEVASALSKFAGYDAANIVTLNDVGSAKILEAAKALADRVPEKGVVFIYFSGVAVNVDGKDYFTGTDTSSPIDTTAMVSKSDVFKPFIQKGSRVFAFMESNRIRNNDSYFGQEEPLIGQVAQTFATIQGQKVYQSTSNGKPVGLFAQGIVSVLKQFRSNSVPIQEFAWEVFYNMKRGGQEGTGGGSVQTPTLPLITYMPTEARF